jgi:RNA polymerase sigma-70 factor (ECF subfamily)
MLGSVTEAEDMLQEAFLRWQGQPMSDIRSAKAWLTSTVTRLCIDHLRSARVRREEYVGMWLPEPLLGDSLEGDHQASALADSLSTAFLVLLETLSPAERAVFLLREVFEHDYAEIARITERSEASCRQMARRARDHVAAGRTRFAADPAQNERLVGEFLESCRQGDTAGLLSLLHEDAVLYSDGGGKVSAVPRPVEGAARIARFLIGVSKVAPKGAENRFAVVNSAPGLLRLLEGRLIQTTTFEIKSGRIHRLYIMRNPDKLRRSALLESDR